MKFCKLIFVFLFLLGCNETPENKSIEVSEIKFDINDFPKIWTRITKINNELINYYPCKGGDRSVQFLTLSNGDKLMHINYNEQYFDFLVSSIVKIKSGYILKVLDRKSYVLKTFRIEKYNENDNLFYWYWVDNENEYRFLFTPFNEQSSFPVVYQPCKECSEIPCQDIEIIEGKYHVTLPYELSLDGNDYREMIFSISKDSTSKLEIYYYPENPSDMGETIKFIGKTKIDSTHFVVEFKNFANELLKYFNPNKEPELEYINDSVFRFRKTVKGLIIDNSFCENWDMKKYKN